jgi:cytoskeletal protein RodZ
VRQGNTLVGFFRRFSVPEKPRISPKSGAKGLRQNRGTVRRMAKGTFGERLKRERELREVTVKEIASATRIAPKFLEALENEDWNKLPGGVFGRGFVRSIARYLGLSEENLLSDYDLARGETAAPATQKPEERIPSPPKWIPALAAILLIAALVGAVFGGRYAWRRYVAHRNAQKTSAVVSIPSSNAGQNPLVNNSPAAPARANEKSLPLDLSVAASTATRVKICIFPRTIDLNSLPRTVPPYCCN